MRTPEALMLNTAVSGCPESKQQTPVERIRHRMRADTFRSSDLSLLARSDRLQDGFADFAANQRGFNRTRRSEKSSIAISANYGKQIVALDVQRVPVNWPRLPHRAAALGRYGVCIFARAMRLCADGRFMVSRPRISTRAA